MHVDLLKMSQLFVDACASMDSASIRTCMCIYVLMPHPFIDACASIHRCGYLFNWRPSGEGNTAALLFLIGTAISGRRNKACNSQSAIPTRGHGFDGFSVFNGSKDIMATCIRHILQAVVALHICAMWLPRAGSILKQNHDESMAKICKFHAKCMR